jgi:hypothetical protein
MEKSMQNKTVSHKKYWPWESLLGLGWTPL